MSDRTPHPDRPRFERAVARFWADKRWVSWKDDLFRFAHPKYAAADDFLSGQGAARFGGRWTPPAGEPTVYASSTPQLAFEETFYVINLHGLPARSMTPRIIQAIEARLSRVLDLTDGDVRRSLGVSKTRMQQADWKRANRAGRVGLTQSIGAAAASRGYEGLLVPSARDTEGHNVAVFPANLRAGSSLRLATS